ncbi:MAG: hypothetical protein ACXW2P_01465 [Thermoanaerobaculia bacterium]
MVRPRFLIALSVIVLFFAPAAAGWLIYRYGVNVPFSDQFDVGRFLLRNHGKAFPPWSDLLALHNESRMVFPRIVFFYLARLSGWNVKWEMAFSLLMACATVALTGYLARLHFDRLTALAAAAVAALLVFSPVQWWDWLVGFQMVMFFPPLLLTVALVSLAKERLLPAAVAAAVATFSFPNGLFLWGALVPAVLVFDHGRRRSVVMAGWIGAAAVSAALYFHGFESPPGRPDMVLPHQAPLAFAAYMLAFLGHPVAWNQEVVVSIAVGAVLVCVLFASTVIAWRKRRRDAAIWAAFALYAGMSAGAAAAGRLKMSIAQALEPRYATIAIYMALGTIMMLFAVARPRIVGIAVALLVAAHLLAVRSEWPAMELFHRERLTGRAAVDFALVAPDQTALEALVWPDARIMRQFIDDLAEIGYIDPLRSAKIKHLDAGAPPWFGDFGIAPLPQSLGAYGWASLPGPRPADAVLITREAPDGEEVVAVARYAWIQRPALGQIDPALFTSGWQHELRVELPPGTKLAAWAYDVRERRAYRMAGRFNVSGRSAVRY